MNNHSRYTRIFYSSKVTNIQFFQINFDLKIIRFLPRIEVVFYAIELPPRSGVHARACIIPRRVVRGLNGPRDNGIVDVHERNHRRIVFNKHLNTNFNGNGFVGFETESENFGTIILPGNRWPLACVLVHPYITNR